MKVKEWFIFSIICIGTWGLFAWYINNPIILPMPHIVLQTMISQMGSSVFLPSILTSIGRVILSVVISSICAFVFAFISFQYPKITFFIDKFLLVLRSIPNVTLIILLLFWLNREMSVFTVSFLLLSPMIYQNLIESLRGNFKTWRDVILLDPQPVFSLIRYVYLPLMKSSIKVSLISAFSMGFKVGIMAEILAQVPLGIGRQMQLARLDVELAQVMAWTIWLLICVFVFDWIIKKVIQWMFDERRTSCH